MATHRLAPGIRLLFSIVLVGGLAAAQTPPFTWDISPSPPEAGNPMKVAVDAAPCWPVYVQLTVGGVPGVIQAIDSPNGSCTFPNSGSAAGDAWCVRIWCVSDSDRRSGVF